jgi:hypothetical protein
MTAKLRHHFLPPTLVLAVGLMVSAAGFSGELEIKPFAEAPDLKNVTAVHVDCTPSIPVGPMRR